MHAASESVEHLWGERSETGDKSFVHFMLFSFIATNHRRTAFHHSADDFKGDILI
jgi:hypothetical protein